jgi:hypothetical protein
MTVWPAWNMGPGLRGALARLVIVRRVQLCWRAFRLIHREFSARMRSMSLQA